VCVYSPHYFFVYYLSLSLVGYGASLGCLDHLDVFGSIPEAAFLLHSLGASFMDTMQCGYSWPIGQSPSTLHYNGDRHPASHQRASCLCLFSISDRFHQPARTAESLCSHLALSTAAHSLCNLHLSAAITDLSLERDALQKSRKRVKRLELDKKKAIIAK
jgi:hypothetical protein